MSSPASRSSRLDHTVTVAVGAQLRLAREGAGLTLAQVSARLADGSGIQVPTLSGYETGTKAFTLGRYVEMCAALQVSPLALLAAALTDSAPHLAHGSPLGDAIKQLAIAERALRMARTAITSDLLTEPYRIPEES